mmetsp:Transcript_39656/g.118659  ORF Transcript_39656/g.118659 Transcript_39656/m.118659 type:complete len:121 (+) Transcript_39656:643-1005(+)
MYRIEPGDVTQSEDGEALVELSWMSTEPSLPQETKCRAEMKLESQGLGSSGIVGGSTGPSRRNEPSSLHGADSEQEDCLELPSSCDSRGFHVTDTGARAVSREPPPATSPGRAEAFASTQ